MGQVFVRRSTAALLFLVAVLSIVCVALLVLLLAPDWRETGGHTSTSSGGSSDVVTLGNIVSKRPPKPVPKATTPRPVPSTTAPPTTTTTTTTTTAAATTTTTATTTTRKTTTTTTERPQEPWEREYRIPRSTVPHHYDLYLHPDLDTGKFMGRVRIVIGVTSPMDYLVTHVKYMNVTKTELHDMTSGGAVPLEDFFEYEPNQFWVVQPGSTLEPGNYTLSLEFEGSLDGSIVGFYRSVYTNKAGQKKSIATSKFQPTDARSAFPCFDEPSFKSTFSTTLIRPSQGYIALSNMPVQHEEADSPSAGLTEVAFEKSVPMVTYLACFIVCDFEYVELMTKDEKPFRVYATPDQISRANYSLHLGVNVLNHFEDYFEVKYPLPKQDMIAIPDFISGAMEHWGLITYREVNLLYDERGSSSYNQQRVAAVVAHELAHMWFGNLVTLDWWDDLWLNEGFASYIEYKGVASYEKDWHMEEQFLVDDLQRVMSLDAQLTSHPIVQPVHHPDEITEIFDTISYSKGASVLRMLENFMGSEPFRIGVRNFLKKYQYKNAVTQDLWTELEQVSPEGLNISTIMDTWTRQMGYPVLYVSSSHHDKTMLELRQSRFLSDPEAKSAKDSPYNYLWDIPVTYVTDVTQREQLWFTRDMDVFVFKKPPSASWVKFNVGQYGYYRVNYESSMWQELISLLRTNPQALNVTDRASLLDDAFNLAEAGLLPYDTALSLLAYLKEEDHYIPWTTAASHLNKMARLLRRTEAYSPFRKYLVNLVSDHVDRMGWNDTGSHLERRARLVLMFIACNNGYEACLEGAYQRLLRWIQDPEYFIPPNTRSLVYQFGIQKAGAEEWGEMMLRYINETNAQEKAKLAAGLASTKEDWIIDRLLLMAKNEDIVRSQDFFSLLNRIAKNPWNTHIVWDYVRSNWEELVDRFTLSNRYLGRMVKYVTTRFATQRRLDQMKEFFEKYPEAGSGLRSRQQALEEVENNIKWNKKHANQLYLFLKQNKGV